MYPPKGKVVTGKSIKYNDSDLLKTMEFMLDLVQKEYKWNESVVHNEEQRNLFTPRRSVVCVLEPSLKRRIQFEQVRGLAVPHNRSSFVHQAS